MMDSRSGMLRDAVIGNGEAWNRWQGGVTGGILYPACLRKSNTIRIPWQVGEKIEPMEPLLFYRYVSVEGQSYLELQLDHNGKPILV